MNRPKINKRRVQKEFTYRKPTGPIRHIARGTVIKGLFEEIESGNSTIQLYARLTLKAIFETCDDHMLERYGPKFEQLTRSPRFARKEVIGGKR